ncbi:MAG TPA: ATP-dependent zinc metalloprotease FtsH [Burkholderiaceae bacterium]|nr:ATP-dependent zinc metalloprotease FtsH [Burkholderiaceae bacterium]
MEKKQQFSLWYFLLAFLLVVAVQDWLAPSPLNNLPYSDFKSMLRGGQLVEVQLSDQAIIGTFRVDPAQRPEVSPQTAERLHTLGAGLHRFRVIRVDDPQLVAELQQAGVRFGGQPQNLWLPTLLSWVVPALVFVGVWMFLIRRMYEQGLGAGGGFLSIGKSKAKVYVETDTKVSFDDVAGVDEAKEELREIVAFLKDPQRYGRLGARVPKGVLLVGPPGTGKTLLARAVAGEAGVPFFSINGSEFVEMFVGVGAARVRDLFEQARQKAPAIIFIDELDALGRARGAHAVGGHDEKEQTLNQLLSELDGFDSSSGLVLLGATNRPEVLDPALLRAGRFDRQVLVDRPDRKGRLQILEVHLKKIRLAPNVDREQIAALTPGFSGAELANLVNEAALLATRRGSEAVELQDFTAAVERIVAGLEKKNRLLNPREREVVAYHEMGHALVAAALPGVDAVHKISIIPRGIGALGYTIQRPTEDRFLMTRDELENKMAVLLGGRAAEHLVFGHLSTGAADDLVKVADIARSMAARYGMDERLGHLAYESEPPRFLNVPEAPRMRQFSEQTAERIDAAIRELVDSAFDKARAILREHRALLDQGAALLLQKETLSEEELAALLRDDPRLRPDSRATAHAAAEPGVAETAIG